MTVIESTERWSRPLQWIHGLLAVAVTVQLLVGSFMQSPQPGRPDGFGFRSHEVMGALILVLIVIHWAWSIGHPEEGIRHLFPWSQDGLRRAGADLRGIARHFALPHGGPRDRSLIGMVHGLGLLAITAMVLLGGVFFVARAAGAGQPLLELIEGTHDVFAVITWIYWGGHLAAVVLHGLLGQPVWGRMFGSRH